MPATPLHMPFASCRVNVRIIFFFLLASFFRDFSFPFHTRPPRLRLEYVCTYLLCEERTGSKASINRMSIIEAITCFHFRPKIEIDHIDQIFLF